MEVHWMDFARQSDERGRLTMIETPPFAIRRVYYVEGVPPDVRRGHHAHKTLRQIAVALRGACTFLLDDGRQKTECRLDNPRRGLLIDEMVWREFYDCSEDCLLLVLASAQYDESDYIRDYSQFSAAVL